MKTLLVVFALPWLLLKVTQEPQDLQFDYFHQQI